MKTIATHMQTVPPPIRERAVALFERVDPEFGRQMARRLDVAALAGSGPGS